MKKNLFFLSLPILSSTRINAQSTTILISGNARQKIGFNKYLRFNFNKNDFYTDNSLEDKSVLLCCYKANCSGTPTSYLTDKRFVLRKKTPPG
ncbi:hypothetical protein [Arachidicoccus sp.]|uniref:hypothetical protein n=1 Tax=Arachidicoccus sp. TaxID=1872624 RepID=UPI003D25E9AA